MTVAISYSEEAMYQLKKLENVVTERILDKIKEAADNPTHFFKRLSGREESKLRVGDYRVIVMIAYAENRIFVESIGHRKNVYK